MEQLIGLLKNGTIRDVKKIINQCYKNHDNINEIKSAIEDISNEELKNLISRCHVYNKKREKKVSNPKSSSKERETKRNRFGMMMIRFKCF